MHVCIGVNGRLLDNCVKTLIFLNGSRLMGQPVQYFVQNVSIITSECSGVNYPMRCHTLHARKIYSLVKMWLQKKDLIMKERKEQK